MTPHDSTRCAEAAMPSDRTGAEKVRELLRVRGVWMPNDRYDLEEVDNESLTYADLRALLAALDAAEADVARMNWLDTEEQRVDRVLAISVKRNFDRTSSEWANAAGPVRDTIDRARTATPTETPDV